MRIGLNLLHALPEIGGGWNYIQRLVAGLGECDHSNQYVAFVTRFSECLVPDQPNFKKVLVRIDSRSRPLRILYENTVLQYSARHYHVDCMHWFASTQAVLNSVPGVVTMYDLQPFLDLSFASQSKQFYLRMMMRWSVKRAEVLLPMSEATAHDLSQLLRADGSRMLVIPPIVDGRFQPMGLERAAEFRVRHGLPERFWLYVAHFYPHKNHVGLLRAYHKFKASGFSAWPLVFRGDPGGAESGIIETISELGLRSDIVFLPRLDELELPLLYSAASAVVFPSYYEGGGIPVIEAMACGCPVVASDIPPVREFAGSLAHYFDPRNEASIAHAMKITQIAIADSDPDIAKRERLTRAEKFRAPAIVNQLINAYARTQRT